MRQLSTPISVFPPQSLKGKYCLSPFIKVGIDARGHVRMCGCSSWMPTSIGNIFETPLDEMLSSELAQKIRQSIVDGTYVYCHPDKCGVLRTQNLNAHDTVPPNVKWAIEDTTRFLTPYSITLGIDNTCNLYCPSCRHSITKSDKEKKENLSKVIAENIFRTPTERPITLTLDTAGDIFSSSFMLDFLSSISIKDFPNLELDIITNGLLCESRWHRLGGLQNHVKRVTVSYDAAESETYERLRRGGKWVDIMRAMEWLKNKKTENGMRFHSRMVVQKENYKQMKAFYELSQQFNCDEIEFQRIQNWGTFTQSQFAEIDVCDPSSVLYLDVVESVKEITDFPNANFWHGIPRSTS